MAGRFPIGRFIHSGRRIACSESTLMWQPDRPPGAPSQKDLVAFHLAMGQAKVYQQTLMALTADSFNVMEYLWEKLQKAPDENHVTFTVADLDVLWQHGFVDTVKHTIDKWRAAFDGHRRPSGSYVLSRADFVAKEAYRYKGEIHIPFDALKINEGLYTDEGFQELVDESVKPSVSIAIGQFDKYFSALKKTVRQPAGLLKIDMRAKRELRKFIDQYPSPLRRLELIFDAMIKQQMIEVAVTGEFPAAVTPRHIAAVQASTFSMIGSAAEKTGKALKAIEKTRSAGGTDDPAKPSAPLKQLRRSRKGMRG